MRKLTVTQKRVIDRALAADSTIRGWDDLPYEVVEELERINNTEILWMETNRYIYDVVMDRLYRR